MKIFNFAVVFYEELCYNIYSRKVGADIMPNIKPVSDLRNYTEELRNYGELLREVTVGSPVFLTKNGRGRYAIVDIEEYEKTKATLKLMGELSKGELSGKEKGWTELAEVEKMLGITND